MNTVSAVSTKVAKPSRLTKKNAPDRLGILAAQFRDIEKEMKEIKNFLKEFGDGTYEGLLYKVDVATYDRTDIDPKKAVELLPPALLALIQRTYQVTSATPRAFNTTT